ncbi:glycosyltransferase [uncultured Paraglaciecola sp.]|uniref:glycosyltransferase n=1 Tax=uncultured Paraglaciecola sp. TaxID=1765024 RepID=UPI0030DA1CB3|tara:strand:- start:23585 stop:24928 length:1344 start_codon:yes stop_codon:yes gene_type:complete
MNVKLRINLLLNRIIEFIKYDYNHLKYPLVVACHGAIIILQKLNKHSLAFKVASNIYRSGWAGSDKLGLQVAQYYFKLNPHLGKEISDKFINDLPPLNNTKKFFKHPETMLDGIITVLKNPNGDEKGALIINYSYYFPLFLRFFDVEKVATSFNIILEPSWAGFCEENILAYTLVNAPIFLQVYEQRDKNFIESLDSNLIPIEVGPSWFINHNNFVPPMTNNRDIDILMVAAWAKFKRHNAFFKAVKSLIENDPSIKITLVGYPVDMTKKQILELAMLNGIEKNIDIYESITPQEVSELQKRAKVNVLWSKFEGNNRAIIEGMFCGTPVIMRKGHNYGEQYDFINPLTGFFADEINFKEKYEKIISNREKMDPNLYVMQNRNCKVGTKIMGDVIRKYEISQNRPWRTDLGIKVNDLHGMAYLDNNSSDYDCSYSELKKCVLNVQLND